MAIGDVWKLTVFMGQGSNEQQNTFHYLEGVAVNEIEGSEILINGFEALVMPAFRNALPSDVAFLQLEAQRVLPGMAIREQNFLVSDVGTHTGDSLTPNAGFVISWSSGMADPRQHGRNWISGLPLIAHAQGVLTTLYREGVAELLKDALLVPIIFSPIGPGRFDLCVFHRADPSQVSSIHYPVSNTVAFASRETTASNAVLTDINAQYENEDIQEGGTIDVEGSQSNDGRYRIFVFSDNQILIRADQDFVDEPVGASVIIDTDHSFGTFAVRGVVKAPVYTQSSRRAERKTTVPTPGP